MHEPMSTSDQTAENTFWMDDRREKLHLRKRRFAYWIQVPALVLSNAGFVTKRRIHTAIVQMHQRDWPKHILPIETIFSKVVFSKPDCERSECATSFQQKEKILAKTFLLKERNSSFVADADK